VEAVYDNAVERITPTAKMDEKGVVLILTHNPLISGPNRKLLRYWKEMGRELGWDERGLNGRFEHDFDRKTGLVSKGNVIHIEGDTTLDLREKAALAIAKVTAEGRLIRKIIVEADTTDIGVERRVTAEDFIKELNDLAQDKWLEIPRRPGEPETPRSILLNVEKASMDPNWTVVQHYTTLRTVRAIAYSIAYDNWNLALNLFNAINNNRENPLTLTDFMKRIIIRIVPMIRPIHWDTEVRDIHEAAKKALTAL
jgi:hypothetical protein